MLLQAARSQLVAVDLQERLMPAIAEGDRVVRHAGVLAQAAQRLGIPITVTEQYPAGLGPTVAGLEGHLAAEAVTVPKMTFSAVADLDARTRFETLRAGGRSQAVVCGAEAHVCVLQTALDLKTAGFDVFVVGDAVSSRSPHSVSAACARLLHANCHWVTTEMVVFEWMERAGTEVFRSLFPLIK